MVSSRMPLRGHGLGHAGDPLAHGPQVERAGDERDPAMAEIQQVLDGRSHPRLVVVAHDARPQIRRRTSRSIMMIGHVHLGQDVEGPRAPLARERQDHAVDPPRLEEPDVGGVQLRVVLRVHQEHRVARRAEHGLGARA